MIPPCDICRTTDPASVFSPPSPFASWRKEAGGVAWAQDVYLCKACGRLWRFHFHPKDMYTESAALIPAAAEALVRAGTPWPVAWQARKTADALVPQYIHLYFERTPLRWREVAAVVVADAVAEGGDGNTFAALRGLFGNRPSLYTGGVKGAEVRKFWAQLAPLRPGAAAGPAEDWRRLEAQARETIRLLEAEEKAARQAALAREASARAPKTTVPYSPSYEERIPGPEVQISAAADMPDSREVLRGALGKVGAAPFAYVLPALGTTLAMEAFAPATHGGKIAGVTFFTMGLMAYAAQASRVAGRWEQPFWKLYIDRFGQIFQLWGVLLLSLLFTFGIGLAIIAIGPEELGYRRELDYLAVALFLLPAARFWPVIVTTFVYRGYIYYQSVDVGSDTHSAWIGPSLKVAWRISAQPGFLQQITLPLFAAAGLFIAVLYATDFSGWARGLLYFVALPFLMQFADEAVERWRVPAEKSGVDR